MRVRRGLSALAMAGALLLNSAPAHAAGDLVAITIVDEPRPQGRWGFAPATRKIQPGTWVTWSNGGVDAHTVTAADGSFDSGNLDPSDGFSWFFDQPGTFAYVCALHPWMMGKIVVGDGLFTAPPPPPPPDDQPLDAPSA